MQDESVIQLVVLLVAIVGIGVSLALMIQNEFVRTLRAALGM